MAAASAGLGIPQLDMLIAPVPKHSSILVDHEPGVEAEPFLYQAASAHLAAGKHVIYLVCNRPPASIRAEMKSFGFGEEHSASRLHFVDAFSGAFGEREPDTIHVDDPTSLEEIFDAVEQAVAAHEKALLVLDGLSTLVDLRGEEEFSARFAKLEKALHRTPMSISLMAHMGYGQALERPLRSYDAIIRVRGMEDRVTYSQYFHLEQARWVKDPDRRPRLYRTIRPGGVFVYIPKIVITGPHNAGKSSFVHSVSQDAVSVDRLGTTVGIDHGRVLSNGIAADLFGTPGQLRFDAALRTIAGQALGVIVIVDSTKPDTFERARQMLDLTWRDGLPAIVGANKQDLPNAMSPEEVRKHLRPPGAIQVVGLSSKEPESARALLDGFIAAIGTGATP